MCQLCLQTHFIICSVHTRFPKTSTWLNKRAKQKQKRHSQFKKQPQQTVVIYFGMKYWSTRPLPMSEKVNEYSLSQVNVQRFILILSHHLTAVNAIFVWHRIDCDLFSWDLTTHEDAPNYGCRHNMLVCIISTMVDNSFFRFYRFSHIYRAKNPFT